MSAEPPAATEYDDRVVAKATLLVDRLKRSLRDSGLDRFADGTLAPENLDHLADAGGEAAWTGDAPAAARDAVMEVAIPKDRLTAELVITAPAGKGAAISYDEAMTALAQRGVAYGLNEALVRKAVDEGLARDARMIVARGIRPVPGIESGWEVVCRNAAPEGSATEERVDFREIAAQRSVAAGDLLARRTPPVPGVEGFDVFGNLIPPPAPAKARVLRAGPGTALRDDGIRATIAGEACVKDDRVSVAPVRHVEGDVDFSTGNIDFPGSVFIAGTILDGFFVRADGDIEVGGSIGAALVQARGAIRVWSGIAGRGKGRLIAGGDVSAKFIENARVETRGSVHARKAIMHSAVDALGTVIVDGDPGAVVGGFVRSGRGLKCRRLGSVTETPTRVCFGEDYLICRRLEKADASIQLLREHLREVDETLARLESAPHPDVSAKLAAVRATMRADLKKLMEARVAVLGQAGHAPAGDVRVRDEAFRGAVLASRGIEWKLEKRYAHARFRVAGDRIEVGAHD